MQISTVEGRVPGLGFPERNRTAQDGGEGRAVLRVDAFVRIEAEVRVAKGLYGPDGKVRLPDAASVTAFLEEKVTARLRERFENRFEEIYGAAAPDPNDRSPEATARRIVRFATGFFDAYAKRNGGPSEEVLDSFLGIVKDAIAVGIAEAEKILGGSSGEIEETKKYIEDYLEVFREEMLSRFRSGAEEGGAEEGSAAGQTT